MDLISGLPVLAQSLGADYYGVADLAPARRFIRDRGGERIARYPRAVVMGIVLLDTLVNLLPERDDPAAAILYRHHSYDVVNLALDQIGLQVANAIQREGYQALPVPASKRSSDELIAGVFSQKLAAHLAGLGWIGKSCLLITPDHGPRVRWIAVLTDAPLVPTGTPMESRCGECSACVDICPVHAFTGPSFQEDEPREARFDAALCDRYFRDMEKSGRPGVCGMCLYICPHGREKTGQSLDGLSR
jgi:epoxyqueuosine reductase